MQVHFDLLAGRHFRRDLQQSRQLQPVPCTLSLSHGKSWTARRESMVVRSLQTVAMSGLEHPAVKAVLPQQLYDGQHHQLCVDPRISARS
jgi:hypothetical protein